LAERLQAWKHAVGYLEDYVSATEKVEKAHAKEYEKVLKACVTAFGGHLNPELIGHLDYQPAAERGSTF